MFVRLPVTRVLPILLLLSDLAWGYRAIERGQDPELQWSELA